MTGCCQNFSLFCTRQIRYIFMNLSTSFQQNRIHYRNYILLLLICLLAYWPLTFGLFSVKNDAIHYFLPYRFHISEALRNREFPFWSPYIYLGNPVYGDMQSGAWNPIVWLFSAIGRYDLTLFHYENLLYIFLGGIGMYKLTNRFTNHSHTALLIAASYMLSGFMLSGQLINWLAAAAFIPFVIHYYILAIAESSSAYATKTGIALFFLFTAGYPSFFILTGYLLIIIFLSFSINRLRKNKPVAGYWKKLLLHQLLILLVFAGLSLPAIVSFIDLLPYYQRGSGTSYHDTVTNAFSIQHSLTLLFPGTINANDIVSVTDITCRNIYIGILPLIILTVLPPKRSFRNILLAALAMFSILFSLGDATPIRKLCYDFIPLLDTFRHPSQMRLFFILALLLLAAPGLKKIISGELDYRLKKKLKLALIFVTSVFFITFLIALSQSSIVSKIATSNNGGIRTVIKNFLESVTLSDSIVLNSLLQLVFLGVCIIWFKKILSSRLFFGLCWVCNLFIMAQLVLPASFVSKVSPKMVNKTIHSSLSGFPVIDLEKSLAENSSDALSHFNISGLEYFYNKRIGISKVTNSPAFLIQQDKFLQTEKLFQLVSSLPVVYLASPVLTLKDTAALPDVFNGCRYAFTASPISTDSCTQAGKAQIKQLSANSFTIETVSDTTAFLVLSQNYYHHWKVKIDDKSDTIYKTNISFMGTQVPPGTHTVTFQFVPNITMKAMWVQLITLIILFATCLLHIYKRKKN